MKLLISNDDGFWAPGIQALIDLLKDEHELYVVAPQEQQSAMSHALTMHYPIRVREVKDDRLKLGLAVSGTPADCVKLALEELLDFKPDYVISGINNGPNLGTDVMYSGTVSAAAEGTIFGVPAMAVSLCEYNHEDFSEAAKAVKTVIDTFINNPQPADILVNVNIPNIASTAIKGPKATILGNVVYHKPFQKRIDPRGKTYYWLAGDIIYDNNHNDSDVMAVHDGYISVTPVHYRQTDYEILEGFKKRFK